MAQIAPFLAASPRKRFVLTSLLFGILNNPASAQLPQDLEAQLRGIEQLGELSMRCTEEFKGKRAPQGSVPMDYGGKAEYTWRFRAGQFYLKVSAPMRSPSGSVVTSVEERSFDSKFFFAGSPPGSGQQDEFAVLTKYDPASGTDPQINQRLLNVKYFSAAGLLVPESPAGWADARIRSLVLTNLEKGELISSGPNSAAPHLVDVSIKTIDPLVLSAQSRDIANRRADLQRSKMSPQQIEAELKSIRRLQAADESVVITYTLDPKRGGAIVKSTMTNSSGMIWATDCENFTRIGEEGIWLPRTVRVSWHAKPGSRDSTFPQVTAQAIYHATEFSANVPAGTPFTLTYDTPGTWIVDRVSDEAVQSELHQIEYQIAMGPDGLRELGEDATRNGHLRRTLLIAANAVAVGIILILLIRRRMNERAN